MIKITVNKIIVRGDKMVEVIALEAMTKDELPRRYTDSDACVMLLSGSRNRLINTDYNDVLVLKNIYTESKFAEAMVKIRKAGERLKEINEELKKENALWEKQGVVIKI